MKSLFFWIEEYLFYPKKLSQKFLSYALLPFSAVYCVVVITKRAFSKPKNFGLPIISVGNLTIGGNGKTPFCIALAKEQKKLAIILRGHKRKSSKMLVVTDKTDVKECADEAKLYKTILPEHLVIVSKNRSEAIEYAKKLGAKSILLDDAFHRSEISKFDILIKPKFEPTNNFCIPSGGYREPKSYYTKADLVVIEDRDFKREVTILNPTKKMLLVTAIAKPQRLDPYLPKENIVSKIYFPDHHFFKKEQLKELIKKYNATSLLVTQKDLVKIDKYNLPLSILKLDITIDQKVVKKVDDFISNFAKF